MSRLLGCDSVLLGKQFLTFQRVVLSSSSDCLTLKALWSIHLPSDTGPHLTRLEPAATVLWGPQVSQCHGLTTDCTILIHFILLYRVYQVPVHHAVDRPPISFPTICSCEPTIFNPDYLTSLCLHLLTWAYDQHFCLGWYFQTLFWPREASRVSLPWCCEYTSWFFFHPTSCRFLVYSYFVSLIRDMELSNGTTCLSVGKPVLTCKLLSNFFTYLLKLLLLFILACMLFV
jgi:hypothetical protein